MNQGKYIARRVRWKALIPVSIRHNAGLIVGSVIVLVITGFIVGTFQIRPIVFSSDGPLELSEVTKNVEGSVDLFDTSIPHSIELIVSDIEFQQMIYGFQVLAEKSWIQADAIIDGTLIPTVGIRLKGNSTLLGLAPGGAPGMEALTGNVTFGNPSTLPLLLSFNEFFEGRAYQGKQEIAIRPAQVGQANLNEALALQLIKDSNQITQEYTWAEFRFNNFASTTRLIIENPNQQYAFSLGLGRGVLFKSGSDNLFTYKGEDTTLYVEDFSQLNAIGSRDISSVINLLEWLENSSDEEFERELADWIDISAFARYVATHKILGNFDDMAGPGRNFLLWYDLDDEKFTVITWDMNLSLVGNLYAAMMPPPDETTVLSPGLDMDLIMEVLTPKGMPDVKKMAEFSDALGMGLEWGNILKDRFIDSEAFVEEIAKAESELSTLWSQAYALQVIEQLAPLIPSSDDLSEEQIALDVERLKTLIKIML